MNNTGTKKVNIMKQTAFLRRKNGEYRACLKFSVFIFVEQIYKMQRLEVSGAVRPIYGSLGVKRLNLGCFVRSVNDKVTLGSLLNTLMFPC